MTPVHNFYETFSHEAVKVAMLTHWQPVEDLDPTISHIVFLLFSKHACQVECNQSPQLQCQFKMSFMKLAEGSPRAEAMEAARRHQGRCGFRSVLGSGPVFLGICFGTRHQKSKKSWKARSWRAGS